MCDRFTLKLGRFYDGDRILQHEEVLDLLNKLYAENQELKKEKCTFDELNYYKQKSASLETALLKEQRINLKLKSINENIKKCLNEETGGL
ncbi:TPA_asm: hypothetical protein CBHJFHIM_00023 [Methanobrevibacter gottschalkii virus vir075]|uniref:Uncharacterized protein n=1 Tax=Methanobrevibacter gottschalkii TaxID=190974 RepID=A0A1H7IBP7_9EURY|nr:hypothetical protein [Methanobrevibacter gottschalkii]SEK58035.1 hypothetical protein SAMN05216439_1157 [Methanobrevibacter gottschalkii]